MPHSDKRVVAGKGRGYLSMAGPQYRFIIFLLIVLGVYTLLLKVFQKLAEFVQLPVFLPIALLTLLLFIGIAGATYSHTIIGPLLRIRKALQHLVEGDTSISLRLREADDPLLKEIVQEISLLVENNRNYHVLVQESTRELFRDLAALEERVQEGRDKSELQKLLDEVRKKQCLLDKAVTASHKK